MNQSIPALSKLDGSIILALSKRPGNQSVNPSAFQAGLVNLVQYPTSKQGNHPLILYQNQHFHLEIRQSFNPAASFITPAFPVLVENSACFDPSC